MSTRATFAFRDRYGTHTVYVHSDGYPSHAQTMLEAALTHAWALPRFEADEFAAAFVAANKTLSGHPCAGGIRLAKRWQDFADTRYHYLVTVDKHGLLQVQMHRIDGSFTGTRTLRKLGRATRLSSMTQYAAALEGQE